MALRRSVRSRLRRRCGRRVGGETWHGAAARSAQERLGAAPGCGIRFHMGRRGEIEGGEVRAELVLAG